ncbi:MAG: branched-chain amino acid ABC transporter permease [Christensenellales bacterium]|jgi:branched-chain amino acid transport system permease protein|nr:branched-chain amino acid ABC transporter permease [Clostridium sp.]MDD7140209.1 branched-chain amino acid ABC transporter permease [Clostridium sp.]MDO4342204.1 branched-chain amino acid ABC transporter permease [Eubacteriales bacterium]MDY6080849.1 branched-chain amino acid ABC transporter permease [Eubacteriales bacterium]
MSALSTILRQIINGLQSGSIYALVALGYSMVYGIIMLLNFAHGDIIMIGAYIAWLCMARFALNPVFAILFAILGCVLLGVSIEKIAYKPLRNSPRISLLITAIGISFLLENAAQMIFGAGAQVIPPFFTVPNASIGQVEIPGTAIVTVAVTALSMVALTLLIQKTKMGKAMRAVSEDTGAAQLMGININRTISFTFAIGSALAGIGSVLYCTAYPQATATMGSMLGLKAFVAAVLGGIGSIPGAMIGGFAIGLAEALVSAAGLSVWKDGVVFAILIVVLLVKPTGILGRSMSEKV